MTSPTITDLAERFASLFDGRAKLHYSLVQSPTDLLFLVSDCWHESSELNDILADLLLLSPDVNATRQGSYTAIATNQAGGTTPLMLAAKNAQAALVLQLINAGADVHLFDQTGKTALHYAFADTASSEVVCQLLAAGIPVDIRDDTGMTPFAYAMTKAGVDKQDINDGLEILLEHGASFEEMVLLENALQTGKLFGSKPRSIAQAIARSDRDHVCSYSPKLFEYADSVCTKEVLTNKLKVVLSVAPPKARARF